eukprot:CAMPEP_0184865290 /NCGR_PEP_ID=MMETSP0580-20130426/17567_1 /TAXON_ID=1118495 /ORGANISM="Dactyliosolen fragilissimus" /LENGTH=1213 /DNA_ID=CAMNT_0027364421 /DNA_START=103 /DNA_END=3744 /DNA_ORIENTATION=+
MEASLPQTGSNGSTESDDDFQMEEDYAGGAPRTDARFPIHDACEFHDEDFLRKLIFVRRDDSQSEVSDDSDSEDDDSSSNCSTKSETSNLEKSTNNGGCALEIPSSSAGNSKYNDNETKNETKNETNCGPDTIDMSISLKEENSVTKSSSIIKNGGNIYNVNKEVDATTTTCTEATRISKNDSLPLKIEDKADSIEKIQNLQKENKSQTVNTQIAEVSSPDKSPRNGESMISSDISPVQFDSQTSKIIVPQNNMLVSAAHLAHLEPNIEAVEITPTPLSSLTLSANDNPLVLSLAKTDSLVVKPVISKEDMMKSSQQKQTRRKMKRERVEKIRTEKKSTYYSPYDLNERDEDENTPLHVAIHCRKLGHMRLLLEAGASPRLKCDNSAPIHTCICLGAIPTLKSFAYDALDLLRMSGADISVRDDSMHTPLYLAVQSNLPSVVGLILSDPAGLETLNMRSDRVGGRPLHAAAKFDVVKLFNGSARSVVSSNIHQGNSIRHRHGAISLQHQGLHLRPNVHNVNGMNGSNAAGNRYEEGATTAAAGATSKAIVTQILLNTEGIEIDPVDNYGRTPLHIASSRGNWPVVRLLLDAGANVLMIDKRGFTAGGLAYKRGMPIPNDLIPALGVAPTLGPGLNTMSPKRDLIMDPNGRTLLLCHELCSRHMSCPPITRNSMLESEPPPENVRRLAVLLNEEVGILRSAEFDVCVWESESRRAAMADILKVHEYGYVERISQLCSQLSDHPNAIASLDADTTISRWSFESAMRAAGSVCDAVDRIMAGDFRNSFCAVRPPGHHAGPRGIVRCPNDPEGSHGFCLLNNVAIGAAYARSMYRNDGIKKVAIIDFDVHHGNGTEEIVRQLIPSTERARIQTPFAIGQIETPKYRPWLDESDIHNVFFASTHGYGPRDNRIAEMGQSIPGGWFYPASGKSYVTDAINSPTNVENPNLTDFLLSQTWTRMGEESQMNCCKIINVGLNLPKSNDVPGMQRVDLRDSYRKKILPCLFDFDPDIIFISAGFDAHKRDTMNFGYVGMVEDDYEWVTEQLVKVANTCCNGRIVSVLEGGYKIHGGIVSPFAKSVASHVRALVDGGSSRELYDKAEGEWESNYEYQMVQERERKRQLRNERLHLSLSRVEDKRLHALSPLRSQTAPLQNEAYDVDAMLKLPLTQNSISSDYQNTVSNADNHPMDDGIQSRKRQRKQVDYKELFEQMKKESCLS